MFSIILLLLLAIFFKWLFFRSIYSSEGLTTPQIAVDGRLWTVDLWFWLILSGLVLSALILNLTSACIERSCDSRKHAQVREQQTKLEKVKSLDLPGP